MIEVISSWTKNIVLAIIVISILEMLLPNNKTKKYVKMVMGLYLLFNIVSPFIQNKDKINISEFNLEKYMNNTQETTVNVNQESMDKRLNEIYVEELEKDIEKKLENRGYDVKACKVEANINKEENSGIENITLQVEKESEETDEEKLNSKETDKEVKNEENNENNMNNPEDESSINQSKKNDETIENALVKEIQKIKEVKIGEEENKEDEENNGYENVENKEITNTDIKKIKNFLIEEYEVNEKCLKIN